MATLRSLKNNRDPDFEVYGEGEDLWMGQYESRPKTDFGGYTPPTYVAPPTTPTARPTTQPRTTRATGRSLPVGARGAGAARETVTTRKPTMPKPEMPSIPAFEAPEWDESAIRKAAQRKAAPRLRSLRRQMEREAGRQYENPNVKRMTLRQAMEGYGLGLGSIMGQAEAAGRAEYGQQYGREFAGAQTTYQAQTQALMQSYQNAFSAYIASMQQTTTTGPPEEGGGWSREDFGPQAWYKFGSKLVASQSTPSYLTRGRGV